jgi:dipeptidyl aminopeptidase/acylaminoacyl peptidase
MADGEATIAPYGAWASPVTAESLAESGIGIADLRSVDGVLHWLESRPAEGGRMVLVRLGAEGPEVVTPREYNVRTRCHEYGGASYVASADAVWFSQFRDQRLYRQAQGEPQPITPEGYRYADLVLADGKLIGVREDHTDPADVKNAIIRLSGEEGDAGEVLWGESDFVAYARVSRDGGKLAWIAWDHPNMPWDDTTLYVADLTADGLLNIEAVAGGPGVSAMEPQWGEDGALYYLSDETGWWNLYRRADGAATSLAPMDAEFGGPLWTFGQANYAILEDGSIAASYSADGGDRLVVLKPGEPIREVELPFSALRGLQHVRGQTIAMIAAGGMQSGAVIKVDAASGLHEVIHQPSPVWLDERYVSRAQAISFPTSERETCHALYYPPANGDFAAPAGAKPPLIVQAHGGPTAGASSVFSLSIQFWTSRGFAVVDVDYRGSSGYGRAYRQRLNGNWGVTDVQDVIAAVRHLVDRGLADPDQIAIHGGSAGGFTVLAALTQSDVFKAGGDFYGVADLEALAKDTHKFESRYLDNLIGPYPQAKDVYVARSPIYHLDGFRSPLLILQGSDDPIVPPNQAHMIRDALRERQVPVSYIEFEREGHGFRRAENIITAKQAELYFYGRVFGFKPADALPEFEIENLPKA